mmetsp:Transcript_107754/g.303598  ORF Transcript_107754/g.303598 Transcript_107754/m.303598 type:complete len:608 (-) Transcript_107754:23-1846(-)
MFGDGVSFGLGVEPQRAQMAVVVDAGMVAEEPLGPRLARLLAGGRVGELLPFPGVLKVFGQEFTHAVVERNFRTKSEARLLRLLPGDTLFVFKSDDVRREAAVMCALQCMNKRWRDKNIQVCGLGVEAVTYAIIPLGAEGGLVEFVEGSETLRELALTCAQDERHLRVLRTLEYNVTCLDKLASSTVAYLTAGYALGIRDGHDDNIMLRDDGALFRIDFGFIFGAKPEIDTPQTIIPHAVAVALKESRWKSIVRVCGDALAALSDGADEPIAWACLKSVPEMLPFHEEAYEHVLSLSFEAFCEDVQRADEWSFMRAAKNRIREAMRFVTQGDWDESNSSSARQARLTDDGVDGGTDPRPPSVVGGGKTDAVSAFLAPSADMRSDAGGACSTPPAPLPRDDPFAPPQSGRKQNRRRIGSVSALQIQARGMIPFPQPRREAPWTPAASAGPKPLQTTWCVGTPSWPPPLQPLDPFAPTPGLWASLAGTTPSFVEAHATQSPVKQEDATKDTPVAPLAPDDPFARGRARRDRQAHVMQRMEPSAASYVCAAEHHPRAEHQWWGGASVRSTWGGEDAHGSEPNAGPCGRAFSTYTAARQYSAHACQPYRPP